MWIFSHSFQWNIEPVNEFRYNKCPYGDGNEHFGIIFETEKNIYVQFFVAILYAAHFKLT